MVAFFLVNVAFFEMIRAGSRRPQKIDLVNFFLHFPLCNCTLHKMVLCDVCGDGWSGCWMWRVAQRKIHVSIAIVSHALFRIPDTRIQVTKYGPQVIL